MTPKEKAKELFEKMYNEIQPNELGKDQESAKQRALIAVDKLIKETGSKFWYDVKKEIEKL
jgi:hypothetical protein